jgi:glycosyltransferase involved in cell wall biosynthesis
MQPLLPLTLIVPAHNEATNIVQNVRKIVETLEALHEPFEVLVVCDGSTDGTAAAAAEIEDARVRVMRYEENRGKGYAICMGIAQARGRLIGWLDADLDIDPYAIVDAVRRFDQAPVNAVIGSKRHPDSRVDYPRSRRVFSWGFQILVRLLFRVNVRDTQVGAKVFRREMLEVVAPLLLIKRYAFDLELLAVGAEFGFDRIEEMPIQIDYRFSGTGIDIGAVRQMFLDTLAIAYRIHLRHWYVRQFAALQRERTEAQAALDRLPTSSSSTLSEILSVNL